MKRGILIAFLANCLCTLAHADLMTGVWYEFSFITVGMQASGCYPADPGNNALNCIQSSANNTVLAPAPAWNYNLPTAETLTVTDAFQHGDSFEIFDANSATPATPILLTPMVPTDGNGCGDNPVDCLADAAESHGTIVLTPGKHSLTITPTAIGDAGSAYFLVAPEPRLTYLVLLTLAGLLLYSRLRPSAKKQQQKHHTHVTPLAAILLLLLLSSKTAHSLAPPTAPDASQPPAPLPATVTGNYDVGPAGNTTTQLRAVVYRRAVLPATPEPLVILLHGQHPTCGRLYNPGAAPTPPQATITVRNPGGAVVHVQPINIIDTPGAAGGVPIVLDLPAGFTQNYNVIAANTLDPPGLPCTRPAAGAPCTEAIRLDNWFYVPAPAAARTCTAGLTEVQNHTGYEYLGLRLAAQGYFVVSIDSNPINNAGSAAADFALIQARGTLIANHLRQLNTWTTAGGAPAGAMIPVGSIDMGHVTLIGHSRGGEGVRAAYNLAAGAGIAGLNIDGVFEIGPTDFQGQNASGTVWNVLLPMCDGDVSNLQGLRPFDRMMRDFAEANQRQKTDYVVWGANHNFYNTQWMTSDTFTDGPTVAIPFPATNAQALAARFRFQESAPCVGPGNTALFNGGPGSPTQRLTALSSVPAFVRANSGNAAAPVSAAFNQNFNTLFALPTQAFDDAAPPVRQNYPPAPPMRIDRAYSPTANCAAIQVMEDFNQADGINTSGQVNTAAGVTVAHINGQSPFLLRPQNAQCTAAGVPAACCTGPGAGTCTPPAPEPPPAACTFGAASPATPAASAPPDVPLESCAPAAAGGNPPCLPNHDELQRVAYIQWPAAGAGVFFQTNWTAPRRPGRNVQPFSTLDFRVSRNLDAVNNAPATTNFSIQLVGANGVLTRARQLADYSPVANDLRGPVGGGTLATNSHPILQTYRIPLTDFGNFAAVARQVSGVRFTFDQAAAPTGAIFLGNIRFVNTFGSGVGAYPATPSASAPPAPAGPSAAPGPGGLHYCGFTAPQFISSIPELGGGPGWTIGLFSAESFPNRNEAAVLTVADTSTSAVQRFTLSYTPGADTNTLNFVLTDAQQASLPASYTVQLQYGPGQSSEVWNCTQLTP